MSWIPRSGREMLAGLVWLPRLLDKARRSEALGGQRLIDGYCYGENDFIDKQLLTFLRTDGAAVSELVRTCSSDEDVANQLIVRSGRTPAEIAAFSAAMRRKNVNFVLLEADEGRLPPGPRTTLIRAFYNGAIMPIAYALFRRDERRRETPSAR